MQKRQTERDERAIDLIHWLRSKLWLDVDASYRAGDIRNEHQRFSGRAAGAVTCLAPDIVVSSVPITAVVVAPSRWTLEQPG